MKKKQVRPSNKVNRAAKAEASLKPKQYKYGIIFGLSVICLIASIMVYQLHQGDKLATGVCDAMGSVSQCAQLATSKYSQLFGIDNSILGIVGFALFIFLSGYQFFKPNKMYEVILAIGIFCASALASFFIYLQMFVLNAYCFYCLVVDISTLIMLIIVLYDLHKRNWKII